MTGPPAALGRPFTQPAPEADVEELRDSADGIGEAVVDALPRIGIALLVLAAFVLAGRGLRVLVRRRLMRHRTPSFARVFSQLTATAVSVVGMGLGLAIAFPSVQPVDLLASAGVVSIAAGFAFKDILQNLLAGILLLFRQPFRGGDQIEVGELTGTVEEINIRETVLTTLDGRRVLVPNAAVYTDVISVRTAQPLLRADFRVGVSYGADLRRARDVATSAAASVPGVADSPPPEAVIVDLTPSSLTLEVRAWCTARQPRMAGVRGQTIESVISAFRAEGIVMPTDTITLAGRPGHDRTAPKG